MPAVEDTLRPRAVTRRRPALCAQAFRRWRSGYRPHVGAVDAVDRLTMKRQCGRDNVVLEADLKGVCDHLDPAWMRRMLGARSAAGACLRLIRQWLRAGVLETEGQILPPVTGTAPGGICSPLLANMYRHDALARWLHHRVKPRCGGEACLIRDADAVGGACQ